VRRGFVPAIDEPRSGGNIPLAVEFPRAKETEMADGELTFGPLGESCVHLCVDMQRIFAEGTLWETPWMPRVLPNILSIVEKHPEHTVFTRFVPAREPGMGQGTWKRYYERWAEMTIEAVGEDMVNLMPALDSYVPPALVFDKHVYSPWMETDLHRQLRQRGIDTLVITGGETEVCVLATVLGAIDLGYRIVLVTDALCSSADSTHDAMLEIYHSRYGMQVEAVTTEIVMENWR
jgi:nicotinamidase-related amidase